MRGKIIYTCVSVHIKCLQCHQTTTVAHRTKVLMVLNWQVSNVSLFEDGHLKDMKKKC